jgi:hypothetical protein
MKVNNKGDGDFTIADEGMHQAVCYAVIDIGTQEGTFNGKPKLQHKCIIIWEFVKLRSDDDRPMVISNFYTASLNEKANLHKHLKSWRGKAFTPEELADFDLSRIIGHGCVLQVIHNESGGKTYANVENIMPLMEGMENITPENEKVSYEMTPGHIPEGIPDWIAEKIRASVEWKEADIADGAPAEVSEVEPF